MLYDKERMKNRSEALHIENVSSRLRPTILEKAQALDIYTIISLLNPHPIL